MFNGYCFKACIFDTSQALINDTYALTIFQLRFYLLIACLFVASHRWHSVLYCGWVWFPHTLRHTTVT